MPEKTNSRRYGVAVCSVAVGLAVRLALSRVLGDSVPYITLYPAVFFAATYEGLGPGILATFLSLSSVLYFLLPSFHRVTFEADAVRAGLFTGASILFCVVHEALRRTRARSDRDRELLHITLSSIGDAVISTDAEGKVAFLNAAARELTGWTQEEAAGKAIGEVFVVTNEKTGLPAEIPVERVIREGKVVNLANHTVLRSREGREIPIEDSAAPISGEKGRVLGVVLVFRDVTGRRAAEESARRNEERLKLALDAGKIGVWDWDIVRDRDEWSDGLYDILGVEQGTFSGRVEEFTRLVHPEDRERIKDAIRASVEEDAPYDLEFRVTHPDGSVHWVCATAKVYRDEQGKPVRMLGANYDITERKQAETKIRQQWHTFDTALSNTPDFTYIFDLDGKFRYINRALLSLLQRSFEEAVGKNFFDLGYPPELAARLQAQIQQVIDTKEPLRDQTPFTAPGGETGYYEYIFVPILGGDGHVQAVAGSTRDITERRAVEEKLRESQERLRAIYGAMCEYTGVLSPDGTLLDCNPASLRFAGNTRDGLLGRRFWDTPWFSATPGMPEIVRGAVERVAAGESVRTEMVLIRPSGEARTFDFSMYPIRNERGEVVLMVPEGRDITDLKRAEEELTRSNKELTRANRELEEFAYVASHDLQEPLRMVNIYTELILDEMDQKSELVRYAVFVREGVQRMEGLIQDLLTFSRAVHSDAVTVGTADLSAALSEALSVLKNRVEESGCVIKSDPLPRVQGDVSQLAHVFQNLLSNALKYCQDGVSPVIHISSVREGNFWVTSVRDHGIGFEPQYAERIFGLFKRLYKEEYPGTGLGLAICKRIVERYGGKIWAEGMPGEGATFYFSLPPGE